MVMAGVFLWILESEAGANLILKETPCIYVNDAVLMLISRN